MVLLICNLLSNLLKLQIFLKLFVRGILFRKQETVMLIFQLGEMKIFQIFLLLCPCLFVVLDKHHAFFFNQQKHDCILNYKRMQAYAAL